MEPRSASTTTSRTGDVPGTRPNKSLNASLNRLA
jgi:hypothetical protein